MTADVNFAQCAPLRVIDRTGSTATFPAGTDLAKYGARLATPAELARAGLGAEPSPETPTDWVPVFVTVHNPDPKAVKTGRLLLSVYEPGDSADLAMFDTDREEWTRVIRGGATAMTCVTVRTTHPVRPSRVHVRGEFVLTSSYGSGEFVP